MPENRYITSKQYSIPSHGHTSKRSVPLTVILAVIFINIYGIIGLAFTGLGSVGAIVFTPNIDFVSPFHFGDETKQTDGTITDVFSTNASIDDRNVRAYHFTFTYNGTAYNNISYSTSARYTKGSAVNVEFEPDHPLIARIEGMDMKPFGLELIFVYLFPVTGLCFIVVAFRKKLRNIHALRYGHMTRGRLVNKTDTGAVINNRHVIDCHFTFKDMNGNEFTAIGSTHKPELVEDEAEERIIYDPDDPANAVVVDAMPASVRKFLSSVPG